jgi:hypothetical protein
MIPMRRSAASIAAVVTATAGLLAGSGILELWATRAVGGTHLRCS